MPFFLPDFYHSEFNDKVPPFASLMRARGKGVIGAIMKASDGPWSHDWFAKSWPAFASAAPARWGIDWLRGGYHFMRWNVDKAEQAKAAIDAYRRGGGFVVGKDIMPALDVEARDVDASKSLIVEYTSYVANAISDAFGTPCMLYTRSLAIDKDIKEHMGCAALWYKSYSAKMHDARDVGFERADTPLCQYVGDGENYTAYPRGIDGFKAELDMNVCLATSDDDMNNLDKCRNALLGIDRKGAGGLTPVQMIAAGGLAYYFA